MRELRTPPHAAESEQAVLGALMLSPDALPKIADWLSADDFYRADHTAIYRGVCELATQGQPCDAVTLGEWFEAQGKPELYGYVLELANTTASAANISAYAEIVASKAKLRKLIDVGTTLAADAYSGKDTSDLVSNASRALNELSGSRIGDAATMTEVCKSWFAAIARRHESQDGSLLGLPTPWARFNSMTNGLKPADLIVIAGRPSMGKSAAATNIATANACAGKRVLFFNLEMTAVSIFNRAIASTMNIPLAWLNDPMDSDPEAETYWPRVTDGTVKMKQSGLLIDDSAGLRREHILARARRAHMRKPLDLIIVDHLHLIPLSGKTRETVEIGEITRDLKALAKELNCPVVLLAQLNRAVESRTSNRPRMADLRESGNIEQDADVIALMYRDDYYAKRDDRQSAHPGMVEIIIAKQREGETGSVWARDRLAYGLIDDYDGPDPMASPAKPSRWAELGVACHPSSKRG